VLCWLEALLLRWNRLIWRHWKAQV